MADLKISQFVDGGTIQTTDEIATNRAGINTKVVVGSAAALDAGAGIGDVIVWQDGGGGTPSYPAADGSRITNITLPTINADDVVYAPESGSIIVSTNVQDAITELDVISQSKVEPGTATVFTRQQNFSNGTLTDGPNISWDLSQKQSTSVTLAGNRTLDNPTNQVANGTYIVRVVQDGTGSRTLAYGSAYKWPGGTAPTLSTGAGAVDILTFVSDGTNMYGVAQLDFS